MARGDRAPRAGRTAPGRRPDTLDRTEAAATVEFTGARRAQVKTAPDSSTPVHGHRLTAVSRTPTPLTDLRRATRPRRDAGPTQRGADVTDTATASQTPTASGADSLTIRDNRTGQSYDVPIPDGTIKAADIGKIKADEDDARPGRLRPRLRQHRLLPQRGHLHRRRQGHPGVPRLPDRAARGEVQLPRGRLPADPRRAAHRGAVRRVGARDHLPHVRARERPQLHGGLPLRRPPDGHAAGLGRRAVHVLPRVAQHRRRRQPAHADRPADREDADAGRLVVPARAGQAVRLPRQRAQLHRELPRACCSR